MIGAPLWMQTTFKLGPTQGNQEIRKETLQYTQFFIYM